MIEKINGRTPEEIKKSMKFCSERSYCSDECPSYSNSTCRGAANALAYIRRLERERDVMVSEIEAYLQRRMNEWDALGDRKHDPANMWGYNFIRACQDDLEAWKHGGEIR